MSLVGFTRDVCISCKDPEVANLQFLQWSPDREEVSSAYCEF